MGNQYLMIMIYLLTLGFLGVYASGRLKKPDGFFNGGKRLGFWVTALSTQATGESQLKPLTKYLRVLIKSHFTEPLLQFFFLFFI